MNRIQTKGLVLRRQDYGEADRILLLLTEDRFLSGFARGVRRLKSKLASGIEVFTETEFSLIEGKSDLLTISSAKPLRVFKNITGDYDRLQVGYSMLSQLVGLKQAEDPRFYRATIYALDFLDEPDSDVHIAELWFTLQILQILGQDPNLSEDHNGVVLQQDLRYFLHPDSGSLVPSENEVAVFDADAIKVWRLARAKAPGYLAAISGADQIAKKTLPTLREFAKYHLE